MESDGSIIPLRYPNSEAKFTRGNLPHVVRTYFITHPQESLLIKNKFDLMNQYA